MDKESCSRFFIAKKTDKGKFLVLEKVQVEWFRSNRGFRLSLFRRSHGFRCTNVINFLMQYFNKVGIRLADSIHPLQLAHSMSVLNVY